MLSASVGGMLPQSTTTNGPLLRGLASWMALATTSLPVPVSPRMSTDRGVGAMRSRTPKTRRMRGLRPTSGPKPSAHPTSTRRSAAGSTSSVVRPMVTAVGVRDDPLAHAERADVGAVGAAEIAHLDAFVDRAQLDVDRAHLGIVDHDLRAGVAPDDDGVDVDGVGRAIGRTHRAAADDPVHLALARTLGRIHAGNGTTGPRVPLLALNPLDRAWPMRVHRSVNRNPAISLGPPGIQSSLRHLKLESRPLDLASRSSRPGLAFDLDAAQAFLSPA